MGMRSPDASAAARPPLLLAASGVLGAEALALLAYTVLNVIDIVTDNSYQVSNGVALVVMQLLVIAGVAWMAACLARRQPWTRTPALMAQAFTGAIAVILLQAHRYGWGAAALLLAVAGLAFLLAPPSFRALSRPAPGQEEPAREEQAQGGRGERRRDQQGPGNPARSGNPARRNPAGKPVSRQP
jgi:hypothetical protein